MHVLLGMVLAGLLADAPAREGEPPGTAAPPNAPATEPAPPPTEAQGPPLAILPVHAPPEVLGEDQLDVLSSVLAAHLAEHGNIKVISPSELRALLDTEANRQALGGSEDEALSEISGAMGAESVVTGKVVRSGKRMTWTATLVKQADGTVLQNADASGETLQALAAQSDEMALKLLGKGAELADPRAAARRLGFKDVADVKDFEGYRKAHPELGTQDALTRYIIAHNIESNRWAVVESVLFAAGSVSMVVGFALALASYLFVGIIGVPVVAIPGGCLGCVLGVGGCLTLLGGLGTVIVDAFNRGRTTVKKEGCCRDDAALQDEVDASSIRRAAALAIMLGGPATSLTALLSISTFGVIIGTATALRQGNLPTGDLAYVSSPQYLIGNAISLGGLYCGSLACWVPCVIAVPAGALLLAWPDKSPVEGLEDE